MADTAADVPGKYDVVINGHGYIFANALAPSLPFRTQRAKYGYSPTFVARQNVSGNFGDNQQDFWLTLSQNDWTAGEDQRYLHIGNPDTLNSFYAGSSIDISVPGQVNQVRASEAITAAGAIVGMGGHPYIDTIFVATSTNLYTISPLSAILTNNGPHGITPGPSIAIAPGQPNSGATEIYLGSPVSGVRRYGSGAFNAFNGTTGPDTLVFANNTLYGATGGTFWSYDTAGTATQQANFKSATGTIVSDGAGVTHKLLYFGGVILYIRPFGLSGGELWQYNGTALSLVASLPPNFELLDACVAMGVVILSGKFHSDRGLRPGIFYYYNGTVNLLWQAETWQSSLTYGAAMVAPFRTGFVFTDEARLQVRFYDLNTGGISALFPYTAPGFTLSTYIATGNTHIAVHSQGTGIDHWPTSVTATSSYVSTSLVDFDTSLLKNFRGVIVEWDAASDGDGGSVDISYRLNSITPTASYTAFQTGAASGTEYFFSGVQGRSISIRVTLKKGTSTYGPALRRIYLRAAPIQQTFRNDEMILDCTGADGKTPVPLRNGNDSPLDGKDMVANIRAAITSSAPISITDRFGTINAVADAANVEIIEIQPQEYWVRFPFREV